jgi:Ca2+-binding EF-hand superfamily protein
MEKEKNRLLMVFRLFDSNKDGKIDEHELKAVIRRFYRHPSF